MEEGKSGQQEIPFLYQYSLSLMTFFLKSSTAHVRGRGQTISQAMRTAGTRGDAGASVPHVFQQVAFGLMFKVQSGHLLRVSVFQLLRHFDLEGRKRTRQAQDRSFLRAAAGGDVTQRDF